MFKSLAQMIKLKFLKKIFIFIYKKLLFIQSSYMWGHSSGWTSWCKFLKPCLHVTLFSPSFNSDPLLFSIVSMVTG